eukprot:Skav205106  [mRNA]  locus=scaffold2918:217741:218553:- [translate_table: standard]
MPPLPVFDDMASEFIEHLWESGEPKSSANYAVAALHYFRPETKHHLPWSWKLVKVWNQLEVPQRATPLSPELLMSFAGEAFKWRQMELGWLLVVGFTLFLRTGELLNLKAQDIFLHGNQGVIYLAPSKGAKRLFLPLERVEVHEQITFTALRALLKGKQAGDRLWPYSRQRFMGYWHDLVHALDLDGKNFFPYSLRRGGASSAYRAGASLDTLVTRGRWQHIATARIYLDTALQALMAFSLPPATHRRLHRAQAEFRRVSQAGAHGTGLG